MVKAQSKFTDDLSVRAYYHYGFVIPEYQYFTYLVKDNVRSFELNLSKQTIGKNYWQQLYKYPEYGISIFYSTLGNDDVFGREIAFYPYFITHIISKKKFSLDNQIGMGLSYVTKRFDLDNNYQDIGVGSKMNIHFNFKLGGKYQLQKKVFLNSGIAFDHFSNGNLQEPNLGINYVTFYGGIGYLIGDQSEKISHQVEPHKPGNEFNVIYSFGAKHSRALQSNLYFTSSVSLELRRKLFRKFHMAIGPDLFYDSSAKTDMQNVAVYKTIYNYRTGIHISQEFVYDKLSLVLQEGVYLLLVDKVNYNVMYNRGIIRYKISDQLFINISMKSHLHILDYPELGLGFYW